MESALLAGRRYESPFSVEELLSLVIPKQQSQDIDMDPCKAPAFIGQDHTLCSQVAIGVNYFSYFSFLIKLISRNQ